MKNEVIYNPNKNIKVSLSRIENMEEKLKEIINQTKDNEIKIKLNYIAQDLLEIKNIYAKYILDRFPIDVRNIANELGKNIEYTYSGGNEIIPRYMEDSILNILTHMIREAIYRIEKNGKIDITVVNQNMELKITIKDTGKALDGKEIKRKAVERGIITEEEASILENGDSLRFLLDKRMDKNDGNIAGRSIGLSHILDEVRALTGSIAVNSEEGVGNTFTFYFPISKV